MFGTSTVKRAATVSLYGIEFEVAGEFIPHTDAHIAADPDDSFDAEGGVFEEVNVYINGHDVYPILDPYVYSQVIRMAERELNR